MKELSIEEKAKRYDEAVERAGKIHNEHKAQPFNVMLKVFPELKENDDWIPKEIAKYLKEKGDFRSCWIAWLEKQGEQKPQGKSAFEAAKEEKVDNQNCVKPDDKVEPKFKIEKGKWYVCIKDLLDNYANKAFRKGDTYLSTQDGSLMPSNSNVPFEVVCPDTYFRDWTINDAKDGDVLACNEEILLFKSYSVQNRISLYCWYNGQTNNFHNKEIDDTSLTTRNKICPATKEQRDILFQKMYKVGYEWNADKKELKKIEQKQVIDYVDNNPKDNWEFVHEFVEKFGRIPEDEDELNVLVEYVLKRKKSTEWSEENMKMIGTLIAIFEVNYPDGFYKVNPIGTTNMQGIHSSEIIKWLKSLRPQNRWKPSNEQMTQLKKYCLDNIPLTSLYEQLKKQEE